MSGLINLLGGLLGGGKQPQLPAPRVPQAPSVARRGAGDAVAEAHKRRRQMAGGGRGSTILGGGTEGNTQSNTLLGG